MAAPKGNEFWKKRSKHGRDYLFENAEALKEAAYEYFADAVAHPLMRAEKGEFISIETKTGKKYRKHQPVLLPTPQPFSLIGFRLYIGTSDAYLLNFKQSLRSKLLPENETVISPEERQRAVDFLSVLSEIEDIIFKQKIDGATVGAYNATIIARELNLKEQTQTQVTGNVHLSNQPITFE